MNVLMIMHIIISIESSIGWAIFILFLNFILLRLRRFHYSMFIAFTIIFIFTIFFLLDYTPRLTRWVLIAVSVLLLYWFPWKVADLALDLSHVFMVLSIIVIILIIEDVRSLSAHSLEALCVRLLYMSWTIIIFTFFLLYFLGHLTMEDIDLMLQINIFLSLSISFHCIKLWGHFSIT